ncbi:hypothetical protein V7S43_018025 [Phytophthora oleae]|uniref:Uncharacterized protein n=1 Tax=Phytophthora oleae TaxID=2107226 RepID=A0ABD3ERP4_9STRA
MMYPSQTLDDAEYFGEKFQSGHTEFQSGHTEIHVLVELPVSKDVKKLRGGIMQTKLRQYAHSDMNATRGLALLRELKLRFLVVRTIPYTGGVGDLTHVEAFKWEPISDSRDKKIKLSEEQQRERYRTYMEENIGDVLSGSKLGVLAVKKDRSILTVELPGHNIRLTGPVNLLILSGVVKVQRFTIRALPDARMVIEVKRDVEESDVYQAMSKLIALDVLANESVTALLTDLVSHWQFFGSPRTTRNVRASKPWLLPIHPQRSQRSGF